MKIIYSGGCNTGLKRKQNQDAILMFSENKKGVNLFVVADGMGGHFHGEYASRAVIEGLKEWGQKLQLNLYEGDFGKMMNSLQNKVEEINREIYETYSQTQVCGSTCVLLLIYDNYYGVINIGDSRIYQKRGWSVSSLMLDDVWENQRKVKEIYSKTDIVLHPDYGKLIQAVGANTKIILSAKTDLLKIGDSFLLCSDGLYKYCPEKYLSKILREMSFKNMEESVNRLIAKTYETGAADNISVILVKCVKE